MQVATTPPAAEHLPSATEAPAPPTRDSVSSREVRCNIIVANAEIALNFPSRGSGLSMLNSQSTCPLQCVYLRVKDEEQGNGDEDRDEHEVAVVLVPEVSSRFLVVVGIAPASHPPVRKLVCGQCRWRQRLPPQATCCRPRKCQHLRRATA